MREPQRLKIFYHPATKEVDFKLYDANGEITAEIESLNKWKQKSGSFILNLQGTDWLDDIVKPFAGQPKAVVEMQTTLDDYEDFKSIVEKYNSETTGTHIILNKLTDELPNMRESFDEIKRQGLAFSERLNEAFIKISNIQCKTQTSALYRNRISNEIKSLSEKMKESLSKYDDNTVNLCFVGAYSSGKSTLINAILGYPILPESIKSETAKMIEISSVKDDKYFIEFVINGVNCVVSWEPVGKNLHIDDGDLKDDDRKLIEDCLSESKTQPYYFQIRKFLEFVNKSETVNTNIKLGFPIPLDSNGLNFRIYDTPGSDSNFAEHRKALKEALSNQNNSILLFVFKPDGMEGSSNKLLLDDFLEQSASANTMIDFDHSLFVVNKADSAKKELKKLKDYEIVGDGFKFSLEEKKLFFVSGFFAYISKAIKNNVVDDEDESLKYSYEREVPDCDDERFGHYYHHDHCGKAQNLTDKMINKANDVLAKAISDNDECLKYLVCSGYYSLEDEIKNYGFRYASTVKTAAIMNTMRNAIKHVSNLVENTSSKSKDELEKVNEKIDNAKQHIECVINSLIEQGVKISDGFKKSLGIDSVSFEKNVKEQIMGSIDKNLKTMLWSNSAKITDEIIDNIETDSKMVLESFNKKYEQARNDLLHKKQDEFIIKLLQEIDSDENLSVEFKKRLKGVAKPDIPSMGVIETVDMGFRNSKINSHQIFKTISNNFNKIVHKMFGTNGNDGKDINSAISEVETNETTSLTTEDVAPKKSIIELVKKKIVSHSDQYNDAINKWITRSVNKDNFRKNIEDYIDEKRENFCDSLHEEFKNALKTVYDDIKSQFIGNLETYSAEFKALQEDKESVEILVEHINELIDNLNIYIKELKTSL